MAVMVKIWAFLKLVTMKSLVESISFLFLLFFVQIFLKKKVRFYLSFLF